MLRRTLHRFLTASMLLAALHAHALTATEPGNRRLRADRIRQTGLLQLLLQLLAQLPALCNGVEIGLRGTALLDPLQGVQNRADAGQTRYVLAG